MSTHRAQRAKFPYTYTVRRYAITDRALFPGSSQPTDKARVPHSSQSHRDEWDSQPPETQFSASAHRVPHSSQSYRDGWGPQISALLAITGQTSFPGSSQPTDNARVPHSSQSHRDEWDSQISALIRQTAQWAADGIDYIQLREKDLSAADLAALTRSILENLRDTPTKLLINSRPDIAIATGAHGVHLTSAPGQLTPSQIRELYTAAKLPPPILSISCHTLAEVEQARNQADLILFAPVFQKSIAGQIVTPGVGLEALHAACLAAAPTPVYALGGVTLENALACLEAGAAGIAGIRLFHTLEGPLP